MISINNPTVPLTLPIQSASLSELLIEIVGRIPAQSQWFAINLQTGQNSNPRDDIGLHLCPRFEGTLSKVVRNSFSNQQWGIEESFGHFPFQDTTKPFTILIWCQNDRFKIAINDQHYADFAYRIPLERINTLIVDGSVELDSVRVENSCAELQTSGDNQYSSSDARDPMEKVSKQQNLGSVKQSALAGFVGLAAGAAVGFGASRLFYPGHKNKSQGGSGKHGKNKKEHKKEKKIKKSHKPKKSGKRKSKSSSSSSSSSSD